MRILIVDDEKRMAESLVEYLSSPDITAQMAYDGIEAKQRLCDEAYDTVVTDLRMPALDGLGLLKWIKESGPQIPVIVMSAHGDIREAVQSIKLGAYDYLVKPFNPDELLLKCNRAVELHRSLDKIELGKRYYRDGIQLIGESNPINQVKKLIEKVARTSTSVLLTGESGTGKEVAARVLHEKSGRSGPFVPVNLGAIPENLIESELFGFEKGSFTGADHRKSGLFEIAQNGSLFLDEIGELAQMLQVKLLRVLQDRKIQRVGGTHLLPIDTRLIFATNRHLEQEVQNGKFREDLFYRINVVQIRMPSLRERKGDINLLAGYFIKKVSQETGKKISKITEEAIDLLEKHPFPGNVRELENLIERAIILSDSSTIDARSFQINNFNLKNNNIAVDVYANKTLREIEKEAILQHLKINAFHRHKTALTLGISRRTLLNKIKEFDMDIPD